MTSVRVTSRHSTSSAISPSPARISRSDAGAVLARLEDEGEELEHEVAVLRVDAARPGAEHAVDREHRLHPLERPALALGGRGVLPAEAVDEQREAAVPAGPGDLGGLGDASCSSAEITARSSGDLGAQAQRPLGPVLEAGVLGHAARSCDALDRGAAGRELLLDPLVAAVEVVDAGDPGLALGGEAGEDQADAGAQVGRHHRRALELLDAGHGGGAAVHLDPRAHAHQLGRVHEAVLEDALLEVADPVGEREQRHHLRLQVGREAGEGGGRHVDGADVAVLRG